MPRPVTLTFDLLTLKSVCESHVTWGILVQSFVFLGLLVFELEPMYATSDRQTDDGRRSPLNAPAPAPPPTGRWHNNHTETAGDVLLWHVFLCEYVCLFVCYILENGYSYRIGIECPPWTFPPRTCSPEHLPRTDNFRPHL